MDSLTELFCLIDDFCQGFEPEWEKRLPKGSGRRCARTSYPAPSRPFDCVADLCNSVINPIAAISPVH
jgi:hypothetical protein